jgi:hypothetical protein
MIRELLQKDFTGFYNKNPENSVPSNSVNVFYNSFKDNTFELADSKGGGIAKYSNPNEWSISTINFENFIADLPLRVRNAITSDICDFIVYSDNNQHFLLNELTNTKPEYTLPYKNTKGQQDGKETKAVNQMSQTLNYLLAVVSINQFIQGFSTRKCCFFNKQPYTPMQTVEDKLINAVSAFNRIATNFGVRLKRPEIDSLEFEFWSFSGNQTCLLEDKSSSLKSIAVQLTGLSAKELNALTEILKS